MIKRRVSALVQFKRAVKRSGVSGYRLAELSGVSEPAINRMLNNKATPRLDNADAILKALGLEFQIVPSKSISRSRR